MEEIVQDGSPDEKKEVQNKALPIETFHPELGVLMRSPGMTRDLQAERICLGYA